MPVYQYACTECGHQLEARQSFTDDPLTECPACAGRLRKVLSAVGVVFKGSGFYRTDSRKEPATASSSSGSGTSNDASSNGSGSGSSSRGTDKKAGGTDKKAPASAAASSGSGTSGAAS